MVLPEILALGVLVKVGHDVLNHVAPIKRHADSPRFYDLSQGFLSKPIRIKKPSPSQLKALTKLIQEGNLPPKPKIEFESNKSSKPELVIIPEEKSIQHYITKSDINTIEEKVQDQHSKPNTKHNCDDEQRSEFTSRTESKRPFDSNRTSINNLPVKSVQVENRHLDSKYNSERKIRIPSKFYNMGGHDYVKIDVISSSITFIPIETKIALNETTIWTGDRYAREVDSSIYNIQISGDIDCNYISGNGPGTCFIKSHEGFYLMKHTYFSKPFDCYSDSFNVTVKRTIKLNDWETPFDSPLTTSQLLELIKTPLPPAPAVNRLSFDVTCLGRGIKRVAFKPLYYKVRGISYNVESKFDMGTDNDIFQDVHFPVLLASGIVHGIYAVVDY